MKQLKSRVFWAGAALCCLVCIAGPALAADAVAPDFDQVMAAPDDPQLNLDYATAQAKAGNLLEAAAALERVIAIHPEWDGARLLYAVVLYRLGDLQGASVQLAQVHAEALTPLQRAEADKYRSQISQGRSRFSVHGTLSAGISSQSDAAGALAVQVNSFFNTPKQSGSARTFAGALDGALKLTDAGPYSIYGSVSGLDMAQIHGPDQHFQWLEGQAGLSFAQGRQSWRIGGVARDYRLFQAQYLKEYGGAAAWGYRLNPADTVGVAGEITSQTYSTPTDDAFVGVNGTHNGDRYDLAVNLEHRFSAQSVISGQVGVEDKAAKYKPFGYSAARIQADYRAGFARGVYLDASGAVRYAHYKAFDAFFLGVRRHDTGYAARLAVGAPISAFTRAGATGDVRENIIVEAAVNHTTRDTVQPLLNYDSTGVELRLIWRFGAPK